MRRLLPLAAVPALIALAACSGGSSPGASSALPATPAAAPAATSAAPSLGPLALGHFPSTTDGRAARGLCEAWAALRQQYASNVDNDSPNQLNQWFSGPDWQQARTDAGKLGNAAAYSSLVAAYGVATVGDTASADSARNVDKACTAGS